MAVKPVILVRPPIGILHDPGFWDELRTAHINEVAIQWLALLDDQGGTQTRYPQMEDTHPRGLAAVGGRPVQRTPVAAYEPNLALYDDLSIQPPAMPNRVIEESKRLKSTISHAAEQGFNVWITDDKGYFLSGGFGDGRPRPAPVCMNDPELAQFAIARTRDTVANFPTVHGMFIDGPDFKWEIKPGHRDDMFVEQCGCRHCQEVAVSIGIGYDRVLQGRDAFRTRLKSLGPAAVDDFIANRSGLFERVAWWLEAPETLDWMRYKAACIERYIKTVGAGLKATVPNLKIASSSRMPALAPLTGHVVRRKAAFVDYQMPKLYWWMGGVAGFRGTLANWIDTLVDWNPGLSPEDAARWFSVAFDLPLPKDFSRQDLETEATGDWFTTTVDDQIRKMIAGSGGVEKFLPWVGLEHFGSQWLTPRELDLLLSRMKAHGVQRYAYFVYNSVKPEIWSVISKYAAD